VRGDYWTSSCLPLWLSHLQEGKEFDALVVDTAAVGSPFDVFDSDTLEVGVCLFVDVHILVLCLGAHR